MPPPAEWIAELIGDSDREHEDSTPIKSEQLAALLDALRDAGRDDLHWAVSLVGLFGLRPAELGVLRVGEGRLYVGSVKRKIRTMKVAKQVFPGPSLDPDLKPNRLPGLDPSLEPGHALGEPPAKALDWTVGRPGKARVPSPILV